MSDENYTLGYGKGSMEWMTSRTADGHGAFLLPYLKPGMRFLDCGCGPGTLTYGFAGYVAPGEAIGIDRENTQSERIRKLAERECVANLRFEQGDIYALPFEDESFDVVFASAVLGSVTDANGVVREMTRVLRPAGVIGLKEFDHDGDLIWPLTPIIEKSIEHYHAIRAHNGHEPSAGRRLKEFMIDNGCRVDYINAYFDQQTTTEELVPYVERNNQLFREVLGPQYYELDWTTPEEMEECIEEWRRFARNPAAIYLSAWIEAIGIKR
ncbi:MAG: class I SAM-dependent methyltransferase [Gammaproteobacteria bacterium]|nr:class I SAM-dependent methyltransferase [Gammaproteobacteria bacterium]MBT8444759.1 class I SAM-dependent methyltransferase [Gammaproteobacteria bacterium]